MLNRRTLIAFMSLGSLASVLQLLRNTSLLKAVTKTLHPIQSAQAQILPTDFVNVLDFGTLTSGMTNDPNIIAANTATIQSAINSVGIKGGGNVYIPAGQYQVTPPSLTVKEPSSIVINYDNIVLFGDGIGKTVLHSRGDWSVIDGNVVRGHGIMVQGTLNPKQPRKNVVIKNLELSGGINGFTGNNKWPADPMTGDGWDLSLIIGGASNAQVKFPQSSTTIKCQSDRYLSGKGEQLKLKFQKSDRKWYEVSYNTTM